VDGATLLTLSRYDLIALIEAQAQQIASLVERIAALDAKLRNPRQRPDNSIPPSSKCQKPNLPGSGKKSIFDFTGCTPLP
jgi:hypothetical protein